MPKRITTWSRNFGSGSDSPSRVEIGARLEDEVVAAGFHRLAFEQRLVAAAVGIRDRARERERHACRPGEG